MHGAAPFLPNRRPGWKDEEVSTSGYQKLHKCGRNALDKNIIPKGGTNSRMLVERHSQEQRI